MPYKTTPTTVLFPSQYGNKYYCIEVSPVFAEDRPIHYSARPYLQQPQ